MDGIDFTEPWDMADVTLVVEGEKLYANKGVLSIWSPVFKSMFNNNFKEKDATEIPLPEKKHSDILELVSVTHASETDLDEDNVGVILPLAREYQMTSLMKRCQKSLMRSPPSLHNLSLAEEFQFDNVREKCADFICSSRISELDFDDCYKKLSNKTMWGFVQRLMKYEHFYYEVQDTIAGKRPSEMPRPLRLSPSSSSPPVYYMCHNDTSMGSHQQGTEKNCKDCTVAMVKAIENELGQQMENMTVADSEQGGFIPPDSESISDIESVDIESLDILE